VKNKIQKLLDYSIKHKLGHIPSALSMLDYLDYLTENILNKDWNIVIGKPYGAQAYYILWNYYWNLDIENLSYGVKHDEIDFVDFSEETIGNALGVASGIQISNKKKTWCNISDAVFQMGSTLEAIQFIGSNQQDILLTVDYNNYQLTGKVSDIMNTNIYDIYSLLTDCNWKVLLIKNLEDYSKIEKFVKNKGPKCILFETIKGKGILEMEMKPKEWHYKKLQNINEITIK